MNNYLDRFVSHLTKTNNIAARRRDRRFRRLCRLQETERDTINAHVDALTRELCSALAELSKIRIYLPGEAVGHIGIVSFKVEGVSPQTVETALGAKGIAVRAGLHCAPWAHEFAGSRTNGGTIRVSLSWFSVDIAVSRLTNCLQNAN